MTSTNDTMALVGSPLPPEADGLRDAIHVAVVAAVAGESMWPGDDARITNGFAYRSDEGEGVGIVDPFISGVIPGGTRFLVFLYPRTITSMRHVWQHPAFPDVTAAPAPAPDAKAESERWLRDWCATHDVPRYEIVMAALLGDPVPPANASYPVAYEHGTYDDGDTYLLFHGRDAHERPPDEFWHHAEIVTGRRFKARPYFICSC